MGACYSKKASGGNRAYTTVHMASTKLDEASRLARPTPYTRTTQNANLDFAVKKGIPMSTKYSSFNTIDHGDIKNLKNTFQSNIPRFSSSLPASTSVEQKTAIINCNENETLHVVNNNAVNSHSASNIPSTTMSTPVNKREIAVKTESQIKPKSVSKSCPDKIVPQECDDKGLKNPVSGKSMGLPRQITAKSSQNISLANPETLAIPKSCQLKGGKNISAGQSPILKSPSQKGSESRDSLSDFDSGIGNSLTDKQKPEDSDTVKDLEHLELLEESSPTFNVDNLSVRSMSTPKGHHQKMNVRAPAYKREPNGKWSFDEKHFSPESEESVDSKSVNMGDRSPREKHSFKMNASDNIFSTYASYKGLLSYQKKSFKPLDANVIVSKEKTNGSEKMKPVLGNSPNVSCIPKIRKQPNQPLTNRSSLFYVQTENEKSTVELENTPSKIEEKSPIKQLVHSPKMSSIDSDDKSDSTENGVLSPPSEVENREFLIDDEISDQPDLTLCCDPNSEDSDLQSLQLAVSELHALQLASSSKKRTDSVSSYSSRKSRTADHRDSLILGSDLGSSCSSIASDDLMLDYEKTFDSFPEGTVNEGPASPMKRIESEDDKVTPLRTEKKFELDEKSRKRLYRRSSGPFVASASDKLEWRHRTVSLPLRPPRPMSVSEADDGSLKLDSSSYRLLCQDLNGVKTLLLRLKSVIQEAETINPFDQANPKNIFYHSLVHNDFPSSFINLSSDGSDNKTDVSKISQENADLRRQIVLLQQQLEEKDHTIHLLQQQMTKYLNCQGGFVHNSNAVNAATQTDRNRSIAGSLSSSSSSADDSIETLVSFRITKCTGRF